MSHEEIRESQKIENVVKVEFFPKENRLWLTTAQKIQNYDFNKPSTQGYVIRRVETLDAENTFGSKYEANELIKETPYTEYRIDYVKIIPKQFLTAEIEFKKIKTGEYTYKTEAHVKLTK